MNLTLFQRDDCPLCDEAYEVLAAAGVADFDPIWIDGDAGLEALLRRRACRCCAAKTAAPNSTGRSTRLRVRALRWARLSGAAASSPLRRGASSRRVVHPHLVRQQLGVGPFAGADAEIQPLQRRLAGQHRPARPASR